MQAMPQRKNSYEPYEPHGPYKPPEISWHIILVIVLLIGLPVLIKGKNFTETGQTVPQKREIIENNDLNNIKMDMDVTYNDNSSRMYVTTIYRNEGLTTAYGIQPVIDLLNSNDEILQEENGEWITAILPNQETTQTILIDLKVTRAEIARIYQEIHYKQAHS